MKKKKFKFKSVTCSVCGMAIVVAEDEERNKCYMCLNPPLKVRYKTRFEFTLL